MSDQESIVSNEDVPTPAAAAPEDKKAEVKKDKKDKSHKKDKTHHEDKDNAGLDAMMNEEIEDKISKSDLKKATSRKAHHQPKEKTDRSQSASQVSGGSGVLRTTRRGVIRADSESVVSAATQKTTTEKEEKKPLTEKELKKKKKKDRKRAKERDRKRKKYEAKHGKKMKKSSASKRKFHSDSSEDGNKSKSSDSSSDSSAEWSIGDGKVDYGSPERLTDGSDQWEGRSIELYDSDNPPDCPLNSYHIKSSPRLLQLQDEDAKGRFIRLKLKNMSIDVEESKKKSNAL